MEKTIMVEWMFYQMKSGEAVKRSNDTIHHTRGDVTFLECLVILVNQGSEHDL